MDDLDRQLLNVIQTDFPIAPHPYQVLARRMDITEEETLARVRSLAESGIIRRIGASFDTRKLGHASALAAARVPTERLEEVANIVSSYPQVTHNYGRDFEYNLWFTLVCRDAEELQRTVEEIKFRTGISDLLTLPAERTFKIKVDFEF